jgi:ribonuclease Z
MICRARCSPPWGPTLAPSYRFISSGCTGGVHWVNAHGDMPYRPPQTHKGVTLTFLGTGSGIPSQGRGMSAALLTAHDRCAHYLFDCGEGTQDALTRASQVHLDWLWRGGVFISHLHGDHVFGLPGLLTGVLARPAPPAGGLLRVFGPPGLHRFLSAAFCAARREPAVAALPLEVNELHWDDAAAWRGGGGRERGGDGLRLRVLRPDASGAFLCVDRGHEGAVRAAPLAHSVPTLGYVYSEADEAHLDPEALRARGVVIPFKGMSEAVAALKAGRAVAMPRGCGGSVTVAPGDALTRGARGRKVAVFSDMCRPTRAALALAAGADVLVHEATCAPGEEDKAEARGHSTPAMAGRVAAAVSPRALLLTHFGRGLLIGARANEMWALGLSEALAAGAGAGARGGGAAAAATTRWAGAYAGASATLESRDVVDSVAAAEASLVAAARSGARQPDAPPPTGDFAFPRVADDPAAAALASAAAAAYSAVGGGGKNELRVLCARDFMRVVVPPPGEEWGVLGPLKERAADTRPQHAVTRDTRPQHAVTRATAAAAAQRAPRQPPPPVRTAAAAYSRPASLVGSRTH